MKERYDKGRKESDYKVGDLIWIKNREMEIGQHHKMAKKWKGPYRITAVDKRNPSVIDVRSVWNRQDEKSVNVALVKRAFVRPGQQIPQDMEAPKEVDEVEEEKEKETEVGINVEEKGRKRKRGRRAGRKINKGKEGEDEEEREGETGEQIKVRNREGRTKFTQAERSGLKRRKGWTEEEEDRDYPIKGIVEEIELHGGERQYRIQFVGFTKLSDARWYDEEKVHEEWREVEKEWERKKKEYGVKRIERKTGTVTKLNGKVSGQENAE